MRLRIIDVPAGEAPAEIRQAWVGLTLPLMAGETKARAFKTNGGVLTGARSTLGAFWRLVTARSARTHGYLVPAARAIQILEDANPSAASWWKEYAPHAIEMNKGFVFNAECGETIE
jgi:hypothetical protein